MLPRKLAMGCAKDARKELWISAKRSFCYEVILGNAHMYQGGTVQMCCRLAQSSLSHELHWIRLHREPPTPSCTASIACSCPSSFPWKLNSSSCKKIRSVGGRELCALSVKSSWLICSQNLSMTMERISSGLRSL